MNVNFVKAINIDNEFNLGIRIQKAYIILRPFIINGNYSFWFLIYLYFLKIMFLTKVILTFVKHIDLSPDLTFLGVCEKL